MISIIASTLGVLRTPGSPVSLYQFTQNVWSHMALEMAFWDIDIQFVEIEAKEGGSLEAVMDGKSLEEFVWRLL